MQDPGTIVTVSVLQSGTTKYVKLVGLNLNRFDAASPNLHCCILDDYGPNLQRCAFTLCCRQIV